MKICTQCDKRVKGLKYLKEFPKENFGFCSFNCMFLWIKLHEVKVNGEKIEYLKNKKGITIYAKDYN